MIAIEVLLFLCCKRQKRKNVHQAPVYASPYNTDSDASPTINSFEKWKKEQGCSEVQQLDGRENGFKSHLGDPSVGGFTELPADPVSRTQ